ncbi:MAG: serine protease [Aphanothece sp. CMT-3BRIN-NPC111]|jgi:S1-C subfamily serine protease|nr:serine protease [Aphanothece sp. CMT-3BRIN-NPC111]
MLLALSSSLVVAVPAQAPNVSISTRSLKAETSLNQLSVKDLYHKARTITVKVFSKEVLGSGILIHRQGSVYTVLTNAHVLIAGDSPYSIQTPDGHIYRAVESLPPTLVQGNDLGILQFSSTNKVYPLASVEASSTLEVGDEVFAAGFPFPGGASYPPQRKEAKTEFLHPSLPPKTREEKQEFLLRGRMQGVRGFVFRSGQVSLVLHKAIEGGYQIGYTNDIEKGMSGGPLLNSQGKVVGINGMHAYPLWGDPYVFKDGSHPDQQMQARITRFSWAIPIETFVQLKQQVQI